jgi:hypothetical protein
MDLIINIINGRFNNYAKVWVGNGYCFYDADSEDRQYFESIITPITDETELKRRFVVVQGSAEKLNEQLVLEAEDDK